MRKLPGVLITLEDYEWAIVDAEDQLLSLARQPVASHYHAMQARLQKLEASAAKVRDAWAKYQEFKSKS